MQRNNDKQNPRFYGRPADKSLQAYKDFIHELTLALNSNAADDLTEDEWRQAWQEFWSGPDQAAGSAARVTSAYELCCQSWQKRTRYC